jgi:hypothetical protein
MILSLKKNRLPILMILALWCSRPADGGVHLEALASSASYVSWRLESDSTILSIEQTAVPIHLAFSVGRSLAFSLHTSHASTLVTEGDAADYVLTGLTDLKLAGSYMTNWRSANDLLLTMSANLPMPQSLDGQIQGLNADQRLAQRWISRDFLDMPATLYWAGPEANVGIYHAVTGSSIVWSFGLSYYYRAPFTYFRYRPKSKLDLSDEITATCGFDFTVQSFLSHLDATYTIRWADDVDGRPYFYPGSKLVINYDGLFRRALQQLGIYGRGLVEVEPGIRFSAVYGKKYNEHHPWIGIVDLAEFGEMGRRQLDVSCAARLWLSSNVNLIALAGYKSFWNAQPTACSMSSFGIGIGLDDADARFAEWLNIEFMYKCSFDGKQDFFGSVYRVSGSFFHLQVRLSL